MTDLLYINASPRGDASASTQAAERYLAALPAGVRTTRLNLFERDLPDFTPALALAKFKFAGGVEMTEDEAAQWAVVEALAGEFIAADRYLFAVPMWNFGVPYRLKQYIDLVTHPGLTFTRDENGMRGLATGAATVVYARGGNYSPKDGQPDPFDFQSTYLKAWFSLVGLGPVSEVAVQGTMSGPEALAQALDAAGEELQALASSVEEED